MSPLVPAPPLSGPLVGDLVAVMVAVVRFHAQNHAMRARAPIMLMAGQCALFAAMLALRPSAGSPAVDVLRLCVLPLAAYVALPLYMYVGGVMERLIAVCVSLLGFCTASFAAVGLAGLRLWLGTPPTAASHGTVTPPVLLEIVSGVAVLPDGLNALPWFTMGAGVVDMGLVMLFDGLLSSRARRYYESADDYARNDRFLLFSTFQLAVLGVSLTLAFSVFAHSPWYFLGAAALGLTCLLVDVLMFSSMERDYRARRTKERVRLLQGRLDDCLRRYDDVVGYVESVARRRHDIRNQLSVVAALARRGDFDAARRHLDALQRAGDGRGGLSGRGGGYGRSGE